MIENSFSKAYGCLMGLAIGDALGSATEGMGPSEIKEKYGRIQDFVGRRISGTDDTEYAILTAKILIDNNEELDFEKVANGWLKYLGDEEDFKRGGTSEIEAIKNLKKGIKPPKSGRIGSANWSDGAVMRIAPIGIYCLGNPKKAARLAKIDASVSHANEGIYCAQALAASISKAFVSDNIKTIIQTGVDFIPKASDSFKFIQEALEISQSYSNPFEAIGDLYKLRSNHICYAPEALGYAYSMFKLGNRNFKQSVLGAVNLGRDADTIAAMTGALTGVLNGIYSLPKNWIDKCKIIKGVCIKNFEGVDLKEIVERLWECRNSNLNN